MIAGSQRDLVGPSLRQVSARGGNRSTLGIAPGDLRSRLSMLRALVQPTRIFGLDPIWVPPIRSCRLNALKGETGNLEATATADQSHFVTDCTGSRCSKRSTWVCCCGRGRMSVSGAGVRRRRMDTVCRQISLETRSCKRRHRDHGRGMKVSPDAGRALARPRCMPHRSVHRAASYRWRSGSEPR